MIHTEKTHLEEACKVLNKALKEIYTLNVSSIDIGLLFLEYGTNEIKQHKEDIGQ